MPTVEPPQSGPLDTLLLRRDLAAPARTLLDVFESVVERSGDAAALDSGAERSTYAELPRRPPTLAAELNAAGIGPATGSGCGSGPAPLDLYVAILGVLVAGAAYVPVDADDPDERARAGLRRGRGGRRRRQRPRRRATGATRRPAARDRAAVPTDDAWVIFTSGSTGTPKGVAVTHRIGGRVRRRRGAPVPAGRPARRPATG